MIRPTIPGIRNFLNAMGAIRIIVISIVKTITGSFTGSSGILFNHIQVLNLKSANVSQLYGRFGL
jgi:hypothetical protein